jgi:hypothetical protein
MRIYGKTLDVNNVPLQRTTIKKITGVNANKVGTFSDDDGNFDFDSESIMPDDEFQISYVGFTPQRFYASELKNKTIKLKDSVMELEPVAVVGVVKKKNQEQLTNNFKLHLQKHKILYAGIGGLLGLALIFTSIKKR